MRSVTEEPKSELYCILIHFDLNGHSWIVATVLDRAELEGISQASRPGGRGGAQKCEMTWDRRVRSGRGRGWAGHSGRQKSRSCEVSGEGTPQTPQCPSLAVPCPTEPGAEAAKDVGVGARAPRDSEVSVISHLVSQCCPPTCQATALSPLVPTVSLGLRRSWGAGAGGMCGPRPLPHPAQRQHPGLRPWRCQLQAGGRADAEPGL